MTRAAGGVGPYGEEVARRDVGIAPYGEGPGRREDSGPNGDAGHGPVDARRVMELDGIMRKYKTGKQRLERRVIESEKWWKLRNEQAEGRESSGSVRDFRAKSGWLHNVIVSKHADAMDSYPEPLILPREPGDKAEAAKLSAILPVILENNRFRRTYSRAWWDKLKTGTAVYHVRWDPDKLNGLGDISIDTVDLLNIFWEPGIEDIQRSRYVFTAELRDNELLEDEYPVLRGKLGGESRTLNTYVYDDAVSTEGKSLVVDAYYKRREQGRTVLHYCKYVGDTVLYSTENEAARGARRDVGIAPYEDGGYGGRQVAAPTGTGDARHDVGIVPYGGAGTAGDREGRPYGETGAHGPGLYDDGRYPFVFDPLWPIKGSPCGYGYVDLCRNPQTYLDLMDEALLRNFAVNVMPRYFVRQDGQVNEQEFLDLQKPLVHVSGSMDEASLRAITGTSLSGNYIKAYQYKVNELRETSGNTESANGIYSSGVTAASAIASLQEASGKTSRDSSHSSYECFAELTDMLIERVRQFYDIPRQFRITGQGGAEEFTSYDNSGLAPQSIGGIGQEDLGNRLPAFDVRIETQKRNAFTRTSQNELMLQLFNLGFFNPQFAPQATACAGLMDFDGKEEFIQTIQRNGGLFEQLQQARQMALSLAQRYEPALAQQLAAGMGTPLAGGGGGRVQLDRPPETGEDSKTARARQRTNQTTDPQR